MWHEALIFSQAICFCDIILRKHHSVKLKTIKYTFIFHLTDKLKQKDFTQNQ